MINFFFFGVTKEWLEPKGNTIVLFCFNQIYNLEFLGV